MWINYLSPSWNCESIGGRNEMYHSWSWLILYTACLPHRKSHHCSVAPGKKILAVWECWRVKHTEGMKMNRAEMQGSWICWIYSFLNKYSVTMLNMPCWDNGVSAWTEGVPRLWFSSVLRAEYAMPLMWVKLVHKEAQAALQGCSRAGFLSGAAGLGLLLHGFMKILENLSEEEHSSTNGGAGSACRHTAVGTCWICPLCVSCARHLLFPANTPGTGCGADCKLNPQTLLYCRRNSPVCSAVHHPVKQTHRVCCSLFHQKPV